MGQALNACLHALGNEQVRSIERHCNLLYCIQQAALTGRQDDCRGYAGTIHEVTLASLYEVVCNC